jgi:multicomponent Na+:H+ antiporter subunit B
VRQRAESVIVLLVSRLLAPFIQIFALYVLFHGHLSPGGGFQGGSMMAASFILIRLTLGFEIGQMQFKQGLELPIGTTGVLIYLGVGLVALGFGGSYLQYAFLPIPGLAAPSLRYFGILFVEIGVATALMAIMLSIFDNLTEREEHD